MASIGRWIGRIAMGIAAVLVVALATIYVMSERYLARTRQVRSVPVTVPGDSASLARGEHLTRLSCMGCHGDSLTGAVMFEAPLVARLIAPNALEASARYSDAQLAGLLRYGIRPDGTGTMTMPPIGLYHLSDADLAAVIAYIRSLPVRTGPALPSTTYGPLGRLGMVIGQFETSADLIDTTAPRIGADTAALGSRLGEYVAHVVCSDCHGKALTGASNGPAPSPSLAGALGYSLDEFRTLVRTGTPREAGKAIPNMADVARKLLVHLSDAEVDAMHAYLASLPATGAIIRRP